MQTAVANVRAKTKYVFKQKKQFCFWNFHLLSPIDTKYTRRAAIFAVTLKLTFVDIELNKKSVVPLNQVYRCVYLVRTLPV